jgi:hypothetical protein
MAQSGYTPIQIYSSSTASATPSAGNLTNSSLGSELAINITDGKLFYKDNSGNIQTIATKDGASGNVVGPASATDNAIARFDGTTGKLIQNSAATIADTTGDISAGAYNKVTITAPASAATLTIADGKTLTANNSLTFNGTDATAMTFPSVNAALAGLAIAQTWTAAQTFRAANAVRSEAASTQDAVVLAGRAGGTSSYAVTLTPTTLSANRTMTLPDADLTVVGTDTTQTLSNKNVQSRVVAIADGTSITINADTTDIATQANTQSAGTLTVNAPTGTPFNGQKLMLRLRSSSVQTFSWNAIFQGSTDVALPSASTGSSKYDYMGFIYNSTAAKWQLAAKNFGF